VTSEESELNERLTGLGAYQHFSPFKNYKQKRTCFSLCNPMRIGNDQPVNILQLDFFKVASIPNVKYSNVSIT
jgi:hypothetical protein